MPDAICRNNSQVKSKYAILLVIVITLGTISHAQEWEQTNGPYGGKITCLDVREDGDIFAGTQEGGMFRSTDAGNSWAEINNGLTDTRMRAVAINDSGHIFAGTVYSGDLFRSTDNGDSWELMGLTNTSVKAIIITAGGSIYVGTEQNVFLSLDNGDTWVEKSSGLTNSRVNALAINSAGDIFAGTEGGGVFISSDSGNNWIPINTGLTNYYIQALTINTGGDVFAGTSYSGMFRSINNGVNWVEINSGLTALSVRSLTVNGNEDIFVGSYIGPFNGGIHRSTNNGNTWTPINNGLINKNISAVSIGSDETIYAGSDGGGIYKSTNNGDNWNAVNSGLTGTWLWDLAYKSNGYLFAATYGCGVFRSPNSGATWDTVSFGLASPIVYGLGINSSGDIFAGTDSGVFRSSTDGDSWVSISDGISGNRGTWVFAFNTAGDVFAGTNDGIFRSTNNGDNWEKINNGLANTRFWALTVNDSDHVFCSGWNGIYRSTNNGDSWVKLENGQPTNWVAFTIAIHQNGDIFAGMPSGTYEGGVYRSTDNGDSWVEIREGLGIYADIMTIAFDADGNVFAGGTNDGGIFLLADDYSEWFQMNNGLTIPNVYSLVLDNVGNFFAGTQGAGVFRLLDGYYCLDADGDGYGNPGHPENNCADDNCRDDYNPDQADVDNDGIGDICDVSRTWLIQPDGSGDMPTIQEAIDAAANGDTVLVADGVYYENIIYRGKNIVVTSYFARDYDPSHIPNTTINGSIPNSPDTGTVVRFVDYEDSTAVLMGFTITGGTGSSWFDRYSQNIVRMGGGILCDSSSPSIKYNIIRDNDATFGSQGCGGAMMVIDGDVYATNNLILRNKRGAFYLRFSGGLLRNNIIAYNTGHSSGGALLKEGSQYTLVENTTMIENETWYAGGAIQVTSGAITLQNSIIWGNTSPNETQIYTTSGTVTAAYCIIEGGYSGNEIHDLDPHLYHEYLYLMDSSPCIDAGGPMPEYEDPANSALPDSAAWPSLGGVRNDIGAYGGPNRFPFELVTAFADTMYGWPPLTVQFSGRTCYDAISWLWHFGDGETGGTSEPTHTYMLSGAHDVTIGVTTADAIITVVKPQLVTVFADTLLGDSVSGIPGESVAVPIYIKNTAGLKSITIPIEFSGDINIQFDSFSVAGCLGEGFTQSMIVYFSSSQDRAVILLQNQNGNDDFLLPPGYGKLVNIYFTLLEPIQPYQFNIIELDGWIESPYTPEFETRTYSYTPAAIHGSVFQRPMVCIDSDGDLYGDPGFPENDCLEDNCPLTYNSDQSDIDGDGKGDSCDAGEVLFDADIRCGAAPLYVAFTDQSIPIGEVNEWRWLFGDGDESTDQNPIHEYVSTDVYNVTLIISDGIKTDSLVKPSFITTQQDIEGDLVATPRSGKVPLTVMFDPVLDGIATEYHWHFGDGDTGIVPNPIHTYTEQGIYTVILIAKLDLDDCFQVDTIVKALHIMVSGLEADFSATPTAGTEPMSVQFTDLSGGDPTAWQWDFGDNTTSNEQHPLHDYANPGFYDVSLRVTNVYGTDSLLRLSYIHADTAYADLFNELNNPKAKPGFDFWYYCTWINLGVTTAMECSLTVVIPPDITFYDVYPGSLITGTFSGYDRSGDTLIIPLGNIDPTPWYGGYVMMYGNLPETAQSGDTLIGYSWLTSTTPEYIVDNNMVACTSIVVSSDDPNDKLCSPLGEGEAGYIDVSQRLYYVIQFENKPEATADAEYIRVVDTLDTDLDWGTLAFGPMSHPDDCDCEFNAFEGIIMCYCDSIMLPPNANPPEGEGFFSYWISPKPDLPQGREIANTAWIRFDYNPWIMAPETGPVFRTIMGSILCGDANSDGDANVGDAVYLINYVFKGGPTPDPECAGDANGDSDTNVGDAVYLINYVFKGGQAPVDGCCP